MTSSTLPNFMRAHLHASVGVLKIGNDILFKEEKSKLTESQGMEDYSEPKVWAREFLLQP
mgnify:FL=1